MPVDISNQVLSSSKAILIAVSDGAGGYGDFLFALKLSQKIKRKYLTAGDAVPPIYIVTQPSGKRKVLDLKGNTEFDVEILTPNELKGRVETLDHNLKIDVGALIEGPVFNNYLIESIESAFDSIDINIPLTMISEYGVSAQDKVLRKTYIQYRESNLTKIDYARFFYTGLKAAHNELGLLIGESLNGSESIDDTFSKLDEKIRQALLVGLTTEEYIKKHDVSLQYSHDSSSKLTAIDEDTAATQYLKTHREFVLGSDKSQDILMIGRALDDKKTALLSVKDKLMTDGFTQISFYNADTKEEQIFFSSVDKKADKVYRVIYASGMTHPSMMACTTLSGPLIGVTGDQSFSEAISARDKIMVYECLAHKENLIQSYDDAVIAQKDDDNVRETIRLLRYSRTDADYETLGKLLRLTDIQAVFYDTNLAICGNDSLTSELMENIFASNKLILSPILAHLVAGREELAVDVLRQQKDAYSLAEVTYLEKLSQARPSASDDSTAMAIRLITHNQLIKYKPAPGTKCADIKLCLLQFISMNDSALYNQSAFIGLLLLSQEKIGLDYRFLSPKGTLFGNRLYIICEDSLRDLGVDSSNISKQAKLEYKSSLASWMTEHHEFAQDTQVVKALKI